MGADLFYRRIYSCFDGVFTSIEGDLLAKHNVSGLEKETSILLHRIVSALHEPRFQEAAMERILKAYNCPIPQGFSSI